MFQTLFFRGNDYDESLLVQPWIMRVPEHITRSVIEALNREDEANLLNNAINDPENLMGDPENPMNDDENLMDDEDGGLPDIGIQHEQEFVLNEGLNVVPPENDGNESDAEDGLVVLEVNENNNDSDSDELEEDLEPLEEAQVPAIQVNQTRSSAKLFILCQFALQAK